MLGDNIKAARKNKCMTQGELAERLNVVRQTVSKWEKNLSVPDARSIGEIGRYPKCRCAYFAWSRKAAS